jgi:hypothetical protein
MCFLHASGWGGMLALVFVVVPVLRGLENREELFLTLGGALAFMAPFYPWEDFS